MKRKCLTCGAPVLLAKEGGDYLWCGRSDDRGQQKCDYVCSERCFLRALVKYAPMLETRRRAEARLLEITKQ
jgi:hypothetical protein